MRRRLCLALFITGGLLALAGESLGGEPLLVSQPFYSGMQFYVYRPSGVPAGWYATYDGYLVYRDSGGVWRYGSKNGASCIATEYIVGSVVPSLAGLMPVTEKFSAFPHAQETSAPGFIPYSAPGGSGGYYSAGHQLWTRNPAFLAIEKWDKSVDRIGVLSKPAAPVAWRGDHPRAIYVWTGRRWYQITLREDETQPLSVLRSRLYELTVQVNQSGTDWRPEDTAVLIQYAAKWGYGWMGRIALLRPSWPAY
ncbi:MAG: hypothetical protein K5841_10285 [Fretibacterium sp.]|nr:hypothetical protein [Fretibacterium sp.]